LAATGAFAQSSVTISGTFDPSVQNQKVTYGSGASVSNSFIGNNGQGTSNITFKGVEDLGGGLKASFLLENDFNARYDAKGNEGATSAGVNGINFGAGGGEQYLGLEGSFGALKVGAANTPSLTAQASRQPFSTKIGGGFNGVTGTGHVRSNNSLVYASPEFAGFKAGAAYGFKHNAQQAATAAQQAATNTGASTTASTNTENQAGIFDLGLNYANGPLKIGASYWETGAWTGAVATSVATYGVAVPKVKQTNFYAQYDLGVANLYAGYHTEKQAAYNTNAATVYSLSSSAGTIGSKTTNALASGADASGWNVGANVPVNANLSLQANYGELKDGLAARAANPLNKKIAAVGMKYVLSKNTSIYAKYVDETNDNIAAAITAGALGSGTGATATAANTAKKITTTLVGIQTNF
jgi:predicted porin